MANIGRIPFALARPVLRKVMGSDQPNLIYRDAEDIGRHLVDFCGRFETADRVDGKDLFEIFG